MGLLSLIAAVLLLAPAAQAATYYAAPNGSDRLSVQHSAPGSLTFAVAHAPQGATVILEDGIYPGPFTVAHPGVIFRAEHWHGASITNLTGPSLWNPAKGVVDVVCQGMVFGPCLRPANDAELASAWSGGGLAGWKFLDCEFTRNDGMGVGDHGLMRHCLFTDQYFNSFDINGCTGFMMQNCMVRRANRGNYWPDNTVGNKCDFVDKITFDGLISYDNVGCGLWFDTDCKDFVIKNSTFFANHAGYTWNSTYSQAHADDESDAGFGFSTEANSSGNSVIRDNVFYSNSYGAIFYHDSGGGKGASIRITGNRFYDDPIVLNAQGGADGNASRIYGNGKITDNWFAFSDTHPQAWWTRDGNFALPPSSQGMVFDYNHYGPAPGTTSPWVTYNATVDGHSQTLKPHSLAELQSAPLSLEAHSQSNSPMPSLRGPLVATYAWPGADATPQQCQFPNNVYGKSGSIHQVNDDETPYINRALAGKSAGQTVRLTIFGHTAFQGSEPYTCEVYDYSGRWITLTLPHVADRVALDKAVPGYAVLRPYHITVTLTSTPAQSPYELTAMFHAGPPTH